MTNAPPPTCDDLTGPASWLCSTLRERMEPPPPPPPPPGPWWAEGSTWAALALVLVLVLAAVAVRRSPRLRELLRAAVAAARVQAQPANVVRWSGPAGRAVLAVVAGAWRFVRAGHGARSQTWRAVAVLVAALLVLGSPMGVGGVALGAVSAATGVPVALLVLLVVGLVAAVVVASRDEGEDRGREWWAEKRLVGALTAAGVLPRLKDDEPRHVLRRRGQPVHDAHGVAVTFSLPGALPWTDVLARRDRIAAALSLDADKLHVTHAAGQPADVVTMTVVTTSPGARRAAVVDAPRTDWTAPVTLGLDSQGREVRFRTRGTHSLFVGSTGSGKTWTARLAVAHAVLDPAVTMFAVIGKDDGSDWRAMEPLCAGYVGGVGRDALPRVEALLREVEQLSESRADLGRDAPATVLLVEEWYRVRLAAGREDKALAKRLDSLMGELLATSRSRNVHIVMCSQRGTVEYVTGDQRANLSQRLVGRTGSEAEVRYVLDAAPAVLPSRAGEFLVSTDEREPSLVRVDELDDAAWAAVCRRAVDLRGARPAVEERSPYARPLPAEPEPVVDPLVAAVVALLADGDPRGMTATAVHAALPEWLAPSTPVALGRALSGHPALTRGHVGSTPVWRLAHPSVASLGGPSADPRRSLGASPTEGLTCDDAEPTFRQPAPVGEPSVPPAGAL